MCSNKNLNKQRVFEIMGKLYGNAHYRSAIQFGDSENDLYAVTEILNEVNALGYSFCTLQRLHDHEDVRFVPIVLQNYHRFDAIRYQVHVIGAVHFRSYAQYVPELLNIYRTTDSRDLQIAITNCLLQIRNPKYKQDYLEIVLEPEYGYERDVCKRDFLIDLLCELRTPEVLPKLLTLVKDLPKEWEWTFLKYAAIFRNPSVIEYLLPYLESEDGELRAMARKANKKLERLPTAPSPNSVVNPCRGQRNGLREP